MTRLALQPEDHNRRHSPLMSSNVWCWTRQASNMFKVLASHWCSLDPDHSNPYKWGGASFWIPNLTWSQCRELRTRWCETNRKTWRLIWLQRFVCSPEWLSLLRQRKRITVVHEGECESRNNCSVFGWVEVAIQGQFPDEINGSTSLIWYFHQIPIRVYSYQLHQLPCQNRLLGPVKWKQNY